MQHRKITAASMLQNGISLNAKCDIIIIMVSFPKSGHILSQLTLYIKLLVDTTGLVSS